MIFWSIFCSDPTFDYECLVLQCFDCILKQFSIVYVLLALWLYGVTTVFTYQGGAWNVTFKLSFLPGFRSYLNLFRISIGLKPFSYDTCNASYQFQKEIRKISLRGLLVSSSLLLSCTERNVFLFLFFCGRAAVSY